MGSSDRGAFRSFHQALCWLSIDQLCTEPALAHFAPLLSRSCFRIVPSARGGNAGTPDFFSVCIAHIDDPEWFRRTTRKHRKLSSDKDGCTPPPPRATDAYLSQNPTHPVFPRLFPCLQMKSIHAFLKLQADLEALELSHHGERPPLPGSTVLPFNPANPPPRPPPPATAAAAAAETAGSSGDPSACTPGESSVGGSGSGGSSWLLPCVSVDAEGNSFFCDRKVALGAGTTGAGIGALSELIPTTGKVRMRDVDSNDTAAEILSIGHSVRTAVNCCMLQFTSERSGCTSTAQC